MVLNWNEKKNLFDGMSAIEIKSSIFLAYEGNGKIKENIWTTTQPSD